MHERPIRSRYVDPLDLLWLATARRLHLVVRRSAAIFSATDGTGLLQLGSRDTLDPDDTCAQMTFHEICHWITNGRESFAQRDWGFELDGELDWREHACLRLQAGLAGAWGLRQMLAPTSQFREYYEGIPEDVLEPLDDSRWESDVVALARVALDRAAGDPWGDPLRAALSATRALRDVVTPFLADYATDLDDDALPSLWGR